MRRKPFSGSPPWPAAKEPLTWPWTSKSGVYGHRITLLDFSPQQLEHFRQVGRLVEFDDIPGDVETALALSGSAAQSKIQSFPGDADFFERVNIIAPTREQACRRLAEVMREKALATMKGPTFQLIEVKFGNYPYDLVKGTRTFKAGTAIAWSASEIRAGPGRRLQARRDSRRCALG